MKKNTTQLPFLHTAGQRALACLLATLLLFGAVPSSLGAGGRRARQLLGQRRGR